MMRLSLAQWCDRIDHVAMLRGQSVVSGSCAKADIVWMDSPTGKRQQVGGSEGIRPLFGRNNEVGAARRAFEPTLSPQSSNKHIGGIERAALKRSDLCPRRLTPAKLGECENYGFPGARETGW